MKRFVKKATKAFFMSGAKACGAFVGYVVAMEVLNNYTIRIERVKEYDNS